MAGTAKYKKTTPVGIDIPIQKMQDLFVSSLYTSVTWDVFGRVYLNEKDNLIIPEIYTGKDYIDVLMNDAVSHCFFVAGDIRNFVGGQFVGDLSIIFMIDLRKYTAVTHRGDEEIINEVVNLLENEPYSFVLERIEIGRSALGTITGDVENDNLQPFFIFAASGSINYETENC